MGCSADFREAVSNVFLRQTVSQLLGDLVHLDALSDGENLGLEALVVHVALQVMNIGKQCLVVSHSSSNNCPTK